ncbi:MULTISPECIES: hypothetical protein [unclassified Corallococcus]|uniref:hypothetical protein n=1 Tax=unclassified Corallococcus TaxID=2685029 RepID=UPI001A8C5337|nr:MULTISPECIES: hypothetical protein [unclassified Corallococcus]MBN9688380.1 hypothetical protein [Corallococcus sp. NCSPR001]WAS87818.1 hypothetical protein O0N60_12760 [Corallococcus sp. NCRR]
MRSRVLYSLCISGLLLACARGARSTPSSSEVSFDSEPVQPCTEHSKAPMGEKHVILTEESGAPHFSSTKVTVHAGKTVYFVSKVNQDQCIGLADGGILANGGILLADGGIVSGDDNPLRVPACQVAFWTLKSTDTKGPPVDWWSCPSDGGCSGCTQPKVIAETIKGTLEVTSGVGP